MKTDNLVLKNLNEIRLHLKISFIDRQKKEFYKKQDPPLGNCVDPVFFTGGKSKQISQGELNIIARLTVTNLLNTYKHTPHPQEATDST